jgi:hypothetical protein
VAILPAALATIATAGPGRPRAGLVDLRAIPDSVLRRPAVAVLAVDGDGLAELYDHPFQRGRRWERVGQVAFLTNGAVQFESPVGVRVHGGGSRQQNPKSLRLFFRTALEAVDAPGRRIGFQRDREHQSLVLHSDRRAEAGGMAWHYVNPIAYEFARRLGVMTAETAPISVVINNAPPRPYILTEYLDLDWLEDRFGHRNFSIFDTKDSAVHEAITAEGPLAELTTRFGAQQNWTLENVAQVIDIDSMSRWFLTVLFCGTRDAAQGKLVRDRSRPDAKWFWVAWDLDHSFGRKDVFSAQTWELDHFETMLGRNWTGPYRDARVVLLKHLFGTSDEFRQSFARRFMTARDSLLTPAWIDSTLSRYEGLAAINGVTDTGYQATIREFLAKRPNAVRDLLNEHLHTTIP